MSVKSLSRARPSKRDPRKAAPQEETAGRLREWAVAEMGCPLGASELPSSEELQALLGASPAGVWERVISHVRSQSSIQEVRDNLKLHLGKGGDGGGGGGGGEEVRMLKAQWTVLEQELSSLRLAVSQFLVDVERLKREVFQADADNNQLHLEIGEFTHKTKLLAAHSLMTQERLTVLREYAGQIRHRVEIFRCNSSEPSFVSSSKGGGAVVSTCTQQVCGLTSSVGQLLRLLDRPAVSSAGLEEAKRDAWTKAESLLTSHPPPAILSSLCEVTCEKREGVERETEAIDLRKDANELKYNLEGQSGEGAGQRQQGALRSVEHHLQEEQLAHVQRSMEGERAKMATEEGRSRLERLSSLVEERLPQHNPTELELLRSSFRLGLEEEGCMAAIACLSSLCSSLATSRDQRREALQLLKEKRARIEEFAHCANARQGQIEMLLRHNSSAKHHLQKQQTELKLYRRQNICSHEQPLLSVSWSLHDSIVNEVRLFGNLSLARMMRSPNGEYPVCDVSIHRAAGTQPAGHAQLGVVMESLGLQCYDAPHKALLRAVQLREEADSFAHDSDRAIAVTEAMKSRSVERKHTEAALTAVRQRNALLGEDQVAAIQESLLQVSQGLVKTDAVEKSLQDWWVLPAQNAVPWVTWEDMQLSKWVDQWRVLGAKLQQLSAN